MKESAKEARRRRAPREGGASDENRKEKEKKETEETQDVRSDQRRHSIYDMLDSRCRARKPRKKKRQRDATLAASVICYARRPDAPHGAQPVAVERARRLFMAR